MPPPSASSLAESPGVPWPALVRLIRLRSQTGTVLLLLPTLLGVSVVAFLLIHLIPGDLVTILLGITAGQNEQTRQALIHALHVSGLRWAQTRPTPSPHLR